MTMAISRNFRIRTMMNNIISKTLSVVLIANGDNSKVLKNIKQEDIKEELLFVECLNGLSLIQMLSKNLNISLNLEIPIRDNFFIIEQYLKKSKFNIIILDKIEKSLNSLDKINSLALFSQIIYLSKKTNISFVISGSIDNRFLKELRQEIDVKFLFLD
jgi:hypothetical protein